MIMKSNDHDKNPEKVNELLKEMTTGNKLGLQYSFNLSSQESTIFLIIQTKNKILKKDHYCTRSQKAIISLMGIRSSSLFSYFIIIPGCLLTRLRKFHITFCHNYFNKLMLLQLKQFSQTFAK